VMGSNPSKFTACGADCPVEHVSWCDAVVFANKLSSLEGLTPAYGNVSNCDAVTWNRSANGYRLPTEAEWEYAARAGTRTPYAGGELDAVGWYAGNSGNTTHPVAQKLANAEGLYDMSGNVWEWTWDVYGAYGGLVTDPTGASAGPGRVRRGGSWSDAPAKARAKFRGRLSPGNRLDSLGLRLARTETGRLEKK
jgi:sulfatase modifying factor 1